MYECTGGRAINAFVRPYATKIAGVPSLMVYHRITKRFVLEFIDDPRVIFISSP